MAGTVRAAKLESPTARARLKRGRQPHWRTLIPGHAHLGWQRKPGAKAGRWVLRTYAEGKYAIRPIGVADDAEEADGIHILSFPQAEAGAREMIDRPASAPARLTVRQAMANYVEFKRAQGQPVRDLLSRTNAHILPTLGDLVVSELTPERLRRWLATLAAMPAMKRSPRGSPQAYRPQPEGDEAVRRRRASANRVLTMLKAALNHSFHEQKVASDTAWRKVKPFRDVDAARVRYLTIAEAGRLIHATDPEFRPLVVAALQTGCRYSELVRLEVADLNAYAGTLAIRRSKSGKARHVILTDEGTEFFWQHCAGRKGGELMFTRADGEPWGPSQQARPMAEACERARIDPPVGIHQLRHTWASLSVMAGMPLIVVARNLGHSTTRMVERHYGHLSAGYITEAIRAAAPKFGIKGDEKAVVPLR
jgi:integrase